MPTIHPLVPSRPRRLLLLGALALSAFIAPPARASSGSPAHQQVKSEPRDKEIHWPRGFSPDQGDLFVHNEIEIAAACSTVWTRIVEAGRWPDWYPNSKNVRVVGDPSGILKRESRFAWTTFGIDVESTVWEFEPPHRLGWFGKATDLTAFHTWLLRPRGAGCEVVTEEVGKGPGAASLQHQDPEAMHRAHELWLRELKRVVEKGAAAPRQTGSPH